jgi:hypothetical protein
VNLHPKLHVGTSSFSSEDWRGGLYPPDLAPREFLSRCARSFETVEIDSTFYRAPSAYLLRKWRGDRGEFDAFHATVSSELGGKLAFLLFQFGYFNRKSACPTLAEFLRRLEGFFEKPLEAPAAAVVAAEIRNPKWLSGELNGWVPSRPADLPGADGAGADAQGAAALDRRPADRPGGVRALSGRAQADRSDDRPVGQGRDRPERRAARARGSR